MADMPECNPAELSCQLAGHSTRRLSKQPKKKTYTDAVTTAPSVADDGRQDAGHGKRHRYAPTWSNGPHPKSGAGVVG